MRRTLSSLDAKRVAFPANTVVFRCEAGSPFPGALLSLGAKHSPSGADKVVWYCFDLCRAGIGGELGTEANVFMVPAAIARRRVVVVGRGQGFAPLEDEGDQASDPRPVRPEQRGVCAGQEHQALGCERPQPNQKVVLTALDAESAEKSASHLALLKGPHVVACAVLSASAGDRRDAGNSAETAPKAFGATMATRARGVSRDS